jgi:hypothetical protein
MKIIDYNLLPNGADTKTMQDLGKIIGEKPDMSKAIVTMYPNLTLQKITEQLGFIHKKNGSGLKPLDSMSFEWLIKVNNIPKIKFAEDCVETGAGGAEFPVILEKKYYDPDETFELEDETQLIVKRVPEKLTANKWRYFVKIVSGNINRAANTAFMTRGRTTKYVSNYKPELSEKGYNKLLFNLEKHRNFISRHRVGDSFSGDWANRKKKVLEHAGVYFTMDEMDKSLLDLLYLSCENSMLLGQGNFDDQGKCLDQTDDGRDIPIGEGLIPQIKRFCGQQRYFNFNRNILIQAINDVVAKKSKKTGNQIVFMVNWLMYQQVQDLMDTILAPRAMDNYFYDIKGNKIKVGAEYNAYTYAGNTITFMENAALTDRYPDRGYGVAIDLDTYDGEPNVQMMTVDNMSLFRGFQPGMGGMTGGASGEMSTTIHGGRIEYMAYRGIKVANPYTSHILEQNVLW